MYSRYHVQATRATIKRNFTRVALRQVLRANVMQDSLGCLFGAHAAHHFCDRRVASGWEYIEEEHAQITALASQCGQERAMRQAFGRLLHTVQDFYAHSNYVQLWLNEHGVVAHDGDATPEPDPVDASDVRLLQHPHLRTGDWVFWRDVIFYIPVLGNVIRRYWVPVNSHEAINLDSPARGPGFRVAMMMARQRTREEYQRVIQTVFQRGGKEAVARFHGFSPLTYPAPAMRSALHRGNS